MVNPSASLLNTAKSILVSFHLPRKVFHNPSKALCIITKMSSWTCCKCTFINPPSQKSRCQICLSAQSQPLLSSSSSMDTSPSKPKWTCAACTFLNSYRSAICEICGTRASASLLSTLELDDDDLDRAHLGSSVGSVFLPLRNCSNGSKGNVGNSASGSGGMGVSGDLKGVNFSVSRGDNVGNGGSREECVSGGKRSLSAVLRPCSNKRKVRDDQGVDGGGGGDDGTSGFKAVNNAANKAIEVKSFGETHLCSQSKTWKILSYNVWFREDLEMHNRMRALGNLIELHSPDVICFQEVTPDFYEIFQRSNWWKGYRCSIPNSTAFPGGYFCMQLSKLPVKSYSSRPFHNSIMGRELCIAEVEVTQNTSLFVATSHLESPCPSPPTWNQMFSKERVEQANEAVKFLEKKRNAIFCGDMNWDDKLDGPFPLSDGWIDAWTEMRPGEVGFTYDTKSNKMISGNKALQKRLDRFVCKLNDFKISGIEMIGMDEIPGLSYVKEKRVKGQVKELVLPVLPSDHYGLLLTISPGDSA